MKLAVLERVPSLPTPSTPALPLPSPSSSPPSLPLTPPSDLPSPSTLLNTGLESALHLPPRVGLIVLQLLVLIPLSWVRRLAYLGIANFCAQVRHRTIENHFRRDTRTT